MGANVLHEDTIFPVQELEIPINVKNTNSPEDSGTIITSSPKDTSQIITGIAGKQGFASITIDKSPDAPNIDNIYKVNSKGNKIEKVFHLIPSLFLTTGTSS